MKLIDKMTGSEAFKAVLSALESGDASVSGLSGPAVSLFASALVNAGRPVLLLCEDMDRAWQAYSDAQVFLKAENKVLIFPPAEMIEGVKMPSSPEARNERIGTLKLLTEDSCRLVISVPDSLLKNVSSPESFSGGLTSLAKESCESMTGVTERLVKNGYRMEHFVEKKGEVSVRGGIMDVYPFSEAGPVRIEFDGDEIASIRRFDLMTQASTGMLERVSIPPADDNVTADGSLADYLPAEAVLFFENAPVKKPPSGRKSIVNNPRKGEVTAEFRTRDIPAFNADIKAVADEIDRLNSRGLEICLYFNNDAEKKRLTEIFLEMSGEAGFEAALGSLSSSFILEAIGAAAITDDTIFSRYATAAKRRKYLFKGAGGPFTAAEDLKPGEFVVHVNYGIGRFSALMNIEANLIKKDFLCIEYGGGNKLYVPVEDVSMVHKYIGFEAVPELSRLGTSGWEKAKQRAKEDVKKTAEELLRFYAERETSYSFRFGEDSAWQKEFEEEFLYDLTPDQAKTVAEIKKDMRSGRPVDRLICGDVGFGKTEVAIRAAFKAATEGKQVALLCPTTILAEQHFNTFSERMADYPVSIGMVSRFTQKAVRDENIRKLKAGGLDIIIGTHRLIQKDIQFKDLGLLIIDDEQRFGVAQKERLKQIKKDVYCISLSATPIPRTLYLSLSGIREISNINTPPAGRIPIQTFITGYNDKVVRAAVMRELDRDGQAYFVHNAVRTIDACTERLRRLIPEARIGYAHGQMKPDELEHIMMDFYRKNVDVLVCSTIIESGLDITSANTMIIERADEFGLSQLYQLRGRVGRGKQQAYAYLTYPPRKAVTGDARRRLDAIEECDELSMGFSIAMKDLEIRGAGSILGKEQHGQIARIGFELYCALLKEEIDGLKVKGGREIPEEKKEVRIDIGVEAYLPDHYVQSSFQKIGLYREMMAAEKPDDVDKIRASLLDRFGPVPKEARELLRIVELRVAARPLGIVNIEEAGRNIVLTRADGKKQSMYLAKGRDKIDQLKSYLTALKTLES